MSRPSGYAEDEGAHGDALASVHEAVHCGAQAHALHQRENERGSHRQAERFSDADRSREEVRDDRHAEKRAGDNLRLGAATNAVRIASRWFPVEDRALAAPGAAIG